MTSSTSRLLIVEDNKADARLVRLVANECRPSCKIIEVSRGRDFLTMIAQSEDSTEAPPSLILIGMNLSGDFTGMELLRIIRASSNWNMTPTIAMSGHWESTVWKEAKNAGADDCLSKDVDFEVFRLQLSFLLSKWAVRSSTDAHPDPPSSL